MDEIKGVGSGSRERDPWTAKAAELLFRTQRETGRLRMLRVFYYAGEGGLTADEAARAADMKRSCYWKRVSEIRQIGLIAPNGKARMGEMEAMQMVSVITDEGRSLMLRRIAAGKETARA